MPPPSYSVGKNGTVDGGTSSVIMSTARADIVMDTDVFDADDMTFMQFPQFVEFVYGGDVGIVAEGGLFRELDEDIIDVRHQDAIAPAVLAASEHTDVDPSTSTTTSSPIINEVWAARLLLLLSAALYGTNFTMVKSLDESLSVGMASTLRFGFAALVMLPWLFAPIDPALIQGAKMKKIANVGTISDAGKRNIVVQFLGEEPTRSTVGLAGMEIGLWNSVGYIAQAVGLKTIPASKSAFICSMAVVTVPLLDFIFGKQLLRRQVLGAGLAAAGVWALEMGGQQDVSSLTSGDVASLIQPLMFGLGFWRMEAAMEKYPTEAGRLAAGQLLMVFLVSFSYLICPDSSTDACNVIPSMSEVMIWLHDPYILGMLFWTGVITTAFTIWMETLALKTLSAAETTLIFSTEPLFGAAFASVVAHECLGPEAFVGAACIIGGCLVSGIDLSKQLNGLSALKLGKEAVSK